MRIKTFILNSFRVNMYVAWDESNECIFIDAACYTAKEQDRVERFVEAQNLKPVALINTHAHIDHIIGNAFLCRRYGIDSYLHGEDFGDLSSAAAYGAIFGFELQEPPMPKALGDSVAFGDTRLRALHTPGHSKGSVSLYEEKGGVVFTGDTLFKGSIGRSDMPGGDLISLLNSLHLVLLSLPDATTVLPGHGFETSIGSERWQNPFLQPEGL
ncbi:MAG: MBL fold metallo-hydrolase [Prevotellaceae bacterium]|jgi:glyoxylase-like metal-dependent hydrolase (beta-lactamase superfamily II)|nr:MBL fold metallo-hydrolase [Prevotellaceae bacterium]